MRKLLLGLMAMFSTITSAPTLAQSGPPTEAAIPQPDGYFIHLDRIKRVVCEAYITDPETGEKMLDPTTGKPVTGHYLGTASYIGENKFLTAEHVIKGTIKCFIDNHEIVAVEENDKLDYAVLSFVHPTSDILPETSLNVACEPFHKGQNYLAVGYALGEDFVVQNFVGSPVLESQHGFEGEVNLIGKSFEGMSGGPIFDERGFIVGIVNGGDSEGRANMVTRSVLEMSICK